MPDNITAPAAGTALATDEIGGVHYPRGKMAFGDDGVATDVSATNPLPVAGSFSVTGSLTDAELRAAPVAVSGALTDAELRAAALTVTVDNLAATQTVDGTVDVGNFPATQTVDGSVNVDNFPATQAVSGSVDVGNFPATQTVDGDVTVSGTTAVSATALPLPAGAATETKQDDTIAEIAKAVVARNFFPITPANSNLATIPDSIYIGEDGDLEVRGADGNDAILPVRAGQTLPIGPTQVRTAGTTITSIFGLTVA